ncbi:MAG TPA: CBS domain-containing protein, partial [Vicinamibacteria bacterium]|nr:CBS domain-containing protein [Vicinamibacteria bacterium]
MVNKGVDAIVVVEEGIAVGMFTASDLARRVSYKRLPMDRTAVKDVMSSPLHYAAPNTPCRDA